MSCATLAREQQTLRGGGTPAAVAPTLTAVATQDAVPLYQRVTLTSADSQEHGQPLDYTISSHTPQLTGSDDPRLTMFNEEMIGILHEAVAQFKAKLAGMPPTPANAPSAFDVRFRLLSPIGPILSIKFEMVGYVTGAAHPYGLNRTVDFDLGQGRDLQLPQLFEAASNFLEFISTYCETQLAARNIAFDPSSRGAAPTLENYRNWNITAEGLLITFDEYEVAAYAAGPQTVLIPYTVLEPLVRASGPLTPYMHPVP
jgi:hypothetical protein